MGISLTLLGAVVPKARPRFSGHAYLPKRYRQWKTEAITQIIAQLPPGWIPLERSHISLELIGSHRGDLDNLAGAILDALVKSETIKDDRVACVPRLIVHHSPGKPTRAHVELIAA